MKTFRLILAFAAVALTAVSCVEKSGKYQTLLAQRDSLLTVEQKYDQTLEILNEIDTVCHKAPFFIFNVYGKLSRSAKSKTA